MNRIPVCLEVALYKTVTLTLLSCCRKGDPFQGPRVGSCLTLGNDETHILTKQEFTGKGHWGRET